MGALIFGRGEDQRRYYYLRNRVTTFNRSGKHLREVISMKISYGISLLLIQSILTELIIIAYFSIDLGDIAKAFTASAALVSFIALFSALLTLILRNLPYWVRIVFVAVGSSLLVTGVFYLYPEVGFGIDLEILFFILLGSSLLAHLLLFMATSPESTEGGEK